MDYLVLMLIRPDTTSARFGHEVGWRIQQLLPMNYRQEFAAAKVITQREWLLPLV
jgi:hypothetical protein